MWFDASVNQFMTWNGKIRLFESNVQHLMCSKVSAKYAPHTLKMANLPEWNIANVTFETLFPGVQEHMIAQGLLEWKSFFAVAALVFLLEWMRSGKRIKNSNSLVVFIFLVKILSNLLTVYGFAAKRYFWIVFHIRCKRIFLVVVCKSFLVTCIFALVDIRLACVVFCAISNEPPFWICYCKDHSKIVVQQHEPLDVTVKWTAVKRSFGTWCKCVSVLCHEIRECVDPSCLGLCTVYGTECIRATWCPSAFSDAHLTDIFWQTNDYTPNIGTYSYHEFWCACSIRDATKIFRRTYHIWGIASFLESNSLISHWTFLDRYYHRILLHSATYHNCQTFQSQTSSGWVPSYSIRCPLFAPHRRLDYFRQPLKYLHSLLIPVLCKLLRWSIQRHPS